MRLFYLILTIVFLHSCSSENDDTINDDPLLNTTWEYKDGDLNIGILKFKENNTVHWRYGSVDYDGKFITGVYNYETTEIVKIKLYFSSIVIWEGVFDNTQLVLYDTDSNNLLYKLYKE